MMGVEESRIPLWMQVLQVMSAAFHDDHPPVSGEDEGPQAVWQAVDDLGVRRIRLLSSNPAKEVALAGLGVDVVARQPLVVPAGFERDLVRAIGRSGTKVLKEPVSDYMTPAPEVLQRERLRVQPVLRRPLGRARKNVTRQWRHEVELARGAQVTDCNAAIFDAANGFAGCIAGIHEVLHRQGLLEGTWTLDADEQLSPRQREAIDRIYRDYPHLTDDEFVQERLDAWLT